ncbi:MAG: hypothetical protein K8Q99_03225 [Acholeplasmataceae bacterium]|nr:hypothetical protein [Acholeplasmataceae bacterium]
MINTYFGEIISFGKTIRFNRKKRNKNYSKTELKLVFIEIQSIIKSNLESLRVKIQQEEYMEGAFDESVTTSPFKSKFLVEYMKDGFYNSKLGFSYVFEKAIDEYIENPSNNSFLTVADKRKFSNYDEKIIELKDRIVSQIDRFLIQDLAASNPEEIIIDVLQFKKEFLYELPKNIKGFICRKLERPELILELSFAYEIPILLTSRSYPDNSFVIIDGIHERTYLNPNEKRIEKLKELSSLHTFELGEKPIYTAKDIKFYATLVDTRNLDRACSSTWYSGLALFKTEYMYITKGCIPTLEEQIEVYSKVISAFGEKTVQIRIPSFDDIKSLDYEGEIYTDLENIRVYDRIFLTNLQAIQAAAELFQKKVAIVIPMMRLGTEIERWKELIESYYKSEDTEENKPFFSIMMETESALLYYEDYRDVDTVVYGLDNYIEECMDKTKHEKIDFEEFMLQAFPDLEWSHQYFRRTGVKVFHFVEGNVLRDPKIFRKLIDKGFKHFVIPLAHIKEAAAVLFKQESTRGKYKGVYAKRKKKKENDE